MIQKFVNLILAGEPQVLYVDWGPTWDFTFVRDVVQANMLAMKTICDRGV